MNIIRKEHETPNGIIRYWISAAIDPGRPTLLFLPGLTADHRLFDKQLDHFASDYNVFVWDAPGHAASRPFWLDFTLKRKAAWLNDIIEKENIAFPVIIGQSMGGYVGQAYAQFFPGKLKGFVSIDSAPLQRKYITSWELWLLKRMEPVYRIYPWKSLLKAGSEGVAETEYGIKLMRDMMMVYDNDPKYYAKLAGHGYIMLAEAIEADLPYELDCPVLLICGEKDRAGSAVRYNKEWSKSMGFHIEWIPGAGHNSNTDEPELINGLIEDFLRENVCGGV